ncbi:unnamed protein product [Chrysodeixis includens]|uniref:Uncharacterized protein n=1 Tax=Chrysodeixis includens TaxID=689277 RepID=A0A9N8KVW1_CHRIL|nr:unnamed protein product [Chrysodeixis includens]
MVATYLLLMLATTVASRNMPKEFKQDFEPSKELQESLFEPPAGRIETALELTSETDDTVPGEKDASAEDSTVEVNHKHMVMEINKANKKKAGNKKPLKRVKRTRFMITSFMYLSCPFKSIRFKGRCAHVDK